jgi:hypothetical protein
MTEHGAAPPTEAGVLLPSELSEPDGFPHDNASNVRLAAPPWWRRNKDVAWEGFDPVRYWDHNYSSLRDDDRLILSTVGRHFGKQLGARPAEDRVGIDVGSGSNLYPAFAMLPWSRKVVLTDHSPTNVAWLRHTAAALPGTWEPFWQELVESAGYGPRDFSEMRRLLGERAEVRQRDVFDFSDHAKYDLGTMFFVAESLTNYPTEFEDATANFLAALKPHAPFAAAFMDSSDGYLVGDQSFPAVKSVTVDRVDAVLKENRADAQVTKIDVLAEDPLRDGYDGMIVAVGTVDGSTGTGFVS